MKYRSRFCVCIIILYLFTATASNAQDKIRTVEKGYLYSNSPIEVVGQELGETLFTESTRVLGGKDWLKHLQLRIKNVSNKNVISFNIDLLIKKDGKVLMGIPVHFRTYTKPNPNSALTLQGGKKFGVLQPGEVVKVKVGDNTLTVFNKELKKYGIEDVERVTLDFRSVYYDDGTRWSMGQESPYETEKSARSHHLTNPAVND